MLLLCIRVKIASSSEKISTSDCSFFSSFSYCCRYLSWWHLLPPKQIDSLVCILLAEERERRKETVEQTDAIENISFEATRVKACHLHWTEWHFTCHQIQEMHLSTNQLVFAFVSSDADHRKMHSHAHWLYTDEANISPGSRNKRFKSKCTSDQKQLIYNR